jgi:hypothetical protein
LPILDHLQTARREVLKSIDLMYCLEVWVCARSGIQRRGARAIVRRRLAGGDDPLDVLADVGDSIAVGQRVGLDLVGELAGVVDQPRWHRLGREVGAGRDREHDGVGLQRRLAGVGVVGLRAPEAPDDLHDAVADPAVGQGLHPLRDQHLRRDHVDVGVALAGGRPGLGLHQVPGEPQALVGQLDARGAVRGGVAHGGVDGARGPDRQHAGRQGPPVEGPLEPGAERRGVDLA